MSYISVTDLKNLLSAGEGPSAATVLSDERLQAAVTNAEAEVNSRLSQRYDVPVTATPTPPLLKRITLAFAALHAMLDYRQTVDLGPHDPYQLRYNMAASLLADIVNGRANLSGATEASSEAYVSPVYNEVDEPLFTIDDFDLTKTQQCETDGRGRWVFY